MSFLKIKATHIYGIFCFKVPLWKEEITRTKELKPLPIVNIGTSKNAKNTILQTMLHEMPVCFMTIFHERGLWSKHGYQPHVNHRQVQTVKWTSISYEQQTNGSVLAVPPMRVSLSFPDETGVDAFDAVTNVSLFCYEAIEGTSCTHDDQQFMSHCSLQLEHENESHTLNGILTDTKCQFLTGDGFRRTLAFFGYKWVDKDGKELKKKSLVELSDIVNFFHLFIRKENPFDFSSHEGFRQFLEEFDLLELYQNDEADDINVALDDFGWFSRSMFPMRLCTWEGQHRWLLMALFWSGYFSATHEVPLQRKPFEEAFKVIADKEKPDDVKAWARERIPKMQLWRTFNVTFGEPITPSGKKNVSTLMEAFQVLHVESGLKTQAQDYNVGTTFPGVMQTLCDDVRKYFADHSARTEDKATPMKNKPKYTTQLFQPLNWQTFWDANSEPSTRNQFQINSRLLMEALEKTLCTDNTISRFLFEKKNEGLQFLTKEEYHKLSEELMACKYFPNKPNGGVKSFNSKVNPLVQYVLELLRLAVWDFKQLNVLMQFFNVPTPKIEQFEPTFTEISSQFTHYLWLQRYIFEVHYKTGLVFKARVTFERMLIENVVLKCSGDEGQCFWDSAAAEWHKEDNTDNPYPLKVFDKHKEVCAAWQKDMKVEGCCNLSFNNTSRLQQKVTYVGQQAILLDMLETLCKYGFYPNILKNEPDNVLLQQYIT